MSYISSQIIKEKIEMELSNKWAKDANHFIGISDNEYYCPTNKEIDNYLKNFPLPILYRDGVVGSEGFDCDDFTFAFKGNISLYNNNVSKKMHSWAVGIIWGRFSWINEEHAANWVFTSEQQLWLIEAQNNKKHNFSECTGDVKLILL